MGLGAVLTWRGEWHEPEGGFSLFVGTAVKGLGCIPFDTSKFLGRNLRTGSLTRKKIDRENYDLRLFPKLVKS